MYTLVLTVLLAMRPSIWDQHPERRVDRMQRTASSMVTATNHPQFLAALLTLGHFESRFAEYVGDGCVRIPRGAPTCSGRKARSYYQVEQVACPEVWAAEPGSEHELFLASKCAYTRWRQAYIRCAGEHPAGDIAGAFAGYRSIDCRWPEGATRAKKYREILEKLR